MPVDGRGFFTARRLALLALACVLHGWTPGAAAQAGAAPQADDMINALRSPRQRNLLVRPTVAPEATAPAAPAASAPVAAPSASPAPAPVTVQASAPLSTPAPLAVAAPPRPTAPAPQVPPPSLSLAIPFEVNSARLRPESGAVLGNLVAAMLSADLKGQRFVIEGHTDASGNPVNNLRLSQARADEVRLYLVALGVHPSRLRAVGKGATEPVNPRDPLSADNRRVRVVTLE